MPDCSLTGCIGDVDGCSGTCESICTGLANCGLDGECYTDRNEMPRNTCASGYDLDESVLESGPLVIEGNTNFATNDFGIQNDDCPDMTSEMGNASNDHVYVFQPTIN